jgi:hypothetical protein
MDAAVEKLKLELAESAASKIKAEAEAMMAKAEVAQANAQIMMLKAQLAELQGKYTALQASAAASAAAPPPVALTTSIESAFDSLSLIPTTALSSAPANDMFASVAPPSLSAIPPSEGGGGQGFGDFDSIPSPMAGTELAR